MLNIQFQILPDFLFLEYSRLLDRSVLQKFQSLEDSELSMDTFSFYTSVSAVFSSKIEGENIELDSYVKHKRFGIDFLPDYTQKIDDLYNAYQFAKKSICNEENIIQAHQILTGHILPESRRGKIRKGNMYVTTSDGKIEYVATAQNLVEAELNKFFKDLKTLLKANLSFEEVLYFASLLHLVFVKIHPFEDGNGRTARLIEKWFMGQKLAGKAWLIQSEKNYYINHLSYYNNIRLLGLEYETLDYSKAMPFLKMLPESLNIQ